MYYFYQIKSISKVFIYEISPQLYSYSVLLNHIIKKMVFPVVCKPVPSLQIHFAKQTAKIPASEDTTSNDNSAFASLLN